MWGSEVENWAGVLPFSLSFPSHGASHMTFTLTRALASHSGPHGRATGGNRLILCRYDLVSIQAHLSLFTAWWRRLLQPVEQRTQAALGAFKQTDPAWIQSPQKWLLKNRVTWTPTVWKSLPFSTLSLFRCRRRRISPSSCSLQPTPPFSWLRGMTEISWKWEVAWVINGESTQMGGGKEFIWCFCLGHQNSDPYIGFTS